MPTETNRNTDRNAGATLWESRIRGMLLGLALGDAVGSRRSEIPEFGMLEGGVATQLAAWTTEGLLRTATRYGGHGVGNPTDVLRYAYQRWALLRGGRPTTDEWSPVFELSDKFTRGWLIDVPAMAQVRGSSPATMTGITQGRAARSGGCQALLRSLPIAAFHRGMSFDGLDVFAREAASITHDDGMDNAPTGFAVRLAAACLQSDSFQRAFDTTIGDGVPGGVDRQVDRLIDKGMEQPCVPQLLERLAPDKTATSAMVGGIYVALSFPDLDTVDQALEFAGWAPDGDSVAAVAEALLGALHGYEALPTASCARLELGWVMDTLARDLARQTSENQTGQGWKGEGDGPNPIDPWWDTKYPGV